MAESNADRIRRGYELWVREGIDEALREFVDPEVELHDVVEMPGAAVYHGHDGARKMWSRWLEAWEEFTMVPEWIEDLGEERYLVAVHLTALGKGSEVPLEVRIFDVWMFRDKKAIRRFASFDRDNVLAAAGISR